ncbi:uncharacterized protein LOC132244545 [Alligator mississippiensis]|uniref:uncharacterized protein LOC132244545 n=1 Tax=Alligator mississippiensis TaxID=8496 RepID=UPI0028777DC0|nr:uncharacterized protein LOC132244545 [Alligator mississippiensis]
MAPAAQRSAAQPGSAWSGGRAGGRAVRARRLPPPTSFLAGEGAGAAAAEAALPPRPPVPRSLPPSPLSFSLHSSRLSLPLSCCLPSLPHRSRLSLPLSLALFCPFLFPLSPHSLCPPSLLQPALCPLLALSPPLPLLSLSLVPHPLTFPSRCPLLFSVLPSLFPPSSLHQYLPFLFPQPLALPHPTHLSLLHPALFPCLFLSSSLSPQPLTLPHPARFPLSPSPCPLPFPIPSFFSVLPSLFPPSSLHQFLPFLFPLSPSPSLSHTPLIFPSFSFTLPSSHLLFPIPSLFSVLPSLFPLFSHPHHCTSTVCRHLAAQDQIGGDLVKRGAWLREAPLCLSQWQVAPEGSSGPPQRSSMWVDVGF